MIVTYQISCKCNLKKNSLVLLYERDNSDSSFTPLHLDTITLLGEIIKLFSIVNKAQGLSLHLLP